MLDTSPHSVPLQADHLHAEDHRPGMRLPMGSHDLPQRQPHGLRRRVRGSLPEPCIPRPRRDRSSQSDQLGQRLGIGKALWKRLSSDKIISFGGGGIVFPLSGLGTRSRGSVKVSSTSAVGQLYLDLVKRCLVDSIYLDDPLADMVLYRHKASTRAWKRPLIRALQAFLARYRMRVVEPYSPPWDSAYATLEPAKKKRLRERGLGWPSRAQTFLSIDRLDNIQVLRRDRAR